MKNNLLFKRFFELVAICSIIYFVAGNFVFAQVVNNAYSTFNRDSFKPIKSEGKSKFQLTSAILQNTLYVKSADEAEYCDFVIQCCENGTIPSRLLFCAYKNSVNAERNQRFIRFQKYLESFCKYEKINLKNEKRKLQSNNKTSFLLFNIPKNSFLKFK
jgi:hypothetical protein